MTVVLVPFMTMFCSSICSGSLLYELDSLARWSVIACARPKQLGMDETPQSQRSKGGVGG